MKKVKKGSWGELLKACQEQGKDKMLERIEVYHKSLESMSANLWAEPEMHNQAHKLDRILLQQDETMIRLRQMSDEDIRISLETGDVGVHQLAPDKEGGKE